MSAQYRITIASPPDREYLVAEIFFDDVQWAEVNRESGALDVEFYPRPDGKPWRVSLEMAMAALDRARFELTG